MEIGFATKGNRYSRALKVRVGLVLPHRRVGTALPTGHRREVQYSLMGGSGGHSTPPGGGGGGTLPIPHPNLTPIFKEIKDPTPIPATLPGDMYSKLLVLLFWWIIRSDRELLMEKADLNAFFHDFLPNFEFFPHFSGQQLLETHFFGFPAKFYADIGVFSQF